MNNKEQKVETSTESAIARNTVLAAVVHFFKVRWTAKRFNIWTKELDKTCKEGYWLGYDNKIYYGHPMAVFLLSAQNSWWLDNGC